MADMNGANWTAWRPIRLFCGIVLLGWPEGWYAVREKTEPGGFTHSFHGPFDYDTEAQKWCDEQNSPACGCAADVPIDVTISPG